MAGADLQQAGAELRAAVLARYKALAGAGRLVIGPEGADITAVVTNYLRPGATFDAAETLLAAAGFAIRPRPTQADAADVNRGRDWEAVLAAAELPPAMPMSRSAAYVELFPRTPLDYTAVARVQAVINTSLP